MKSSLIIGLLNAGCVAFALSDATAGFGILPYVNLGLTAALLFVAGRESRGAP